jgi:hypothetical protein
MIVEKEKKEMEKFELNWKKIDDLGFTKVLDYSNSLSKIPYKIDKNNLLLLYKLVYDIMMSKNKSIRDLCLQRLNGTIKFHCQNIYDKIISNENNDFLSIFINNWNSYKNNVVNNFILKVFKYLNYANKLIMRNYDLEKEMNAIFKVKIYDSLEAKLKSNFFDYINIYRNYDNNNNSIENKNNSIENKNNINEKILILKDFILFLDYFDERNFYVDIKNNTYSYYTNLSNSLIKNSFIEYFNFFYDKLNKEDEYLKIYLNLELVNDINERLKEIVFYNNSEKILSFNDGFLFLLNNEKENSNLLKKIFNVFHQNEKSLNILLNLFKTFIKEKFYEFLLKNNYLNSNLNLKEIANSNFLNLYLNFQKYILSIIEKNFNNHNLFNVVFKEIMEQIQKQKENINTSYLLPYHFDKYLRKSAGISSISNTAIEGINSGLQIFSQISEQDIFIEIYRNLLCNRLVNNDYVSIDAEKYLIEQLKKQCGNEYISKIDTMIMDYNLNTELTNNFKEFLNNNSNENNNFISAINNINSSLMILSNEHWPINNFNMFHIKLPNNLITLQNLIFKYYHINYPGRTVQWAYENSKVELNAVFPHKKYKIICNTIQACVLLLFNDKNILFNNFILFSTILKLLNIENKNDLENNIKPLLNSSLLIKLNDENNNDKFILNKNFGDENEIIKVEMPIKKENYVRKEYIEEDRSMAIDGMIVKILKSKKKMEFNEVINYILTNLERFRVKVESIKKRINSLIERELIGRDKNDANILTYIYNSNNF